MPPTYDLSDLQAKGTSASRLVPCTVSTGGGTVITTVGTKMDFLHDVIAETDKASFSVEPTFLGSTSSGGTTVEIVENTTVVDAVAGENKAAGDATDVIRIQPAPSFAQIQLIEAAIIDTTKIFFVARGYSKDTADAITGTEFILGLITGVLTEVRINGIITLPITITGGKAFTSGVGADSAGSESELIVLLNAQTGSTIVPYGEDPGYTIADVTQTEMTKMLTGQRALIVAP